MKQNTTYKQTELGLIPEDWEVKKIDDVLDIFPTASYSRAEQCEDGDVQYLHYGDIHTKYNFHLKINNNNLPKISVDKLKNYKTLEIGDLIMADASEDYDGVGKCVEIIELSEKKAIAGLHTFLLRDKKQNFSLGFKGYMTTSNIVKKQFYRTAVGTKVYSLSKTSLQNLKIPLPPLPEQKKIADCLSTWDVAIEKQNALINALTDRKKALMQQLLTGKKRLPGFEGKWKEVKLGEIIIDYKEKPNDNNNYEILTSSKNGLMKQTDYYGDNRITNRTDADYNVIPNGFITYRSRSDDGLFTFNLNDLGVIGLISGYYPVFSFAKSNTQFLLSFLNYFKSKLIKYAIGTSQLVLSINALKEAKFKLPSLEEQTAIAEILATADRELQLQKDKLAQLQSQKKGLMQVLLTGKKRLIN